MDTEQVVISREPFACTWLVRQDRTPRLRLVANTDYWDTSRGPHLQEVVFRNDLSPERALDLVCTAEGEVDIVTQVPPAEAARVERSEHAKLVGIDAIRSLVGVINREADGLPLEDCRARQALNHAVDRDRLVRDTLHGRAQPLGGLTPPSAVTFLHRLSPYPHDAGRASELWREAGGGKGRLRIAVLGAWEAVAEQLAADFREALGLEAEVVAVYRGESEPPARRRLAERTRPREWDLLVMEHGAQAADGPPLEFHRAFVGWSGEFTAGPVIPEFEKLYDELVGETSALKQTRIAYRIDRFVYEEALALFLCAPQALYAVNRHVTFTPYRTTFELPECRVSAEHWSRRQAPIVGR